jgi:hypothetical protein
MAMSARRQLSEQEDFIQYEASSDVRETHSVEAAALTDYDRLVAQGARLAFESEYHAAEKKLRKALLLHPELPMTFYMIELVLHEIGDLTSEADMFLSAMAKFPEGSAMWGQAACCVFQPSTPLILDSLSSGSRHGSTILRNSKS